MGAWLHRRRVDRDLVIEVQAEPERHRVAHPTLPPQTQLAFSAGLLAAEALQRKESCWGTCEGQRGIVGSSIQFTATIGILTLTLSVPTATIGIWSSLVSPTAELL